ncbi:MAG: isocitrate lyase/phosphoenolpyruvate mutase family protein [Pseudomonadota bacterium]
MLSQKEKAQRFRALHVAGDPLVLFNVWDAGSAGAVAASGARALATGSWSVAAANGYPDGERLPLDFALDNLARIVRATELPLSFDIESGYGDAPDVVARTVERTIAAGAIGCNLEDSFPADGTLRAIDAHAARIRQARKAADATLPEYFINARTDVFFQKGVAHDEAALELAIARAHAYAEAGASGIFVPGLADEGLIAQLVKASPLPVNIMVGANTPPLPRLAALGVARVSHGPGPYLLAMKALEAAARAALER